MLPPVAADAALPRAPARAGARHAARASTTSTRASARPGRTSRTRPSPQAYYNKRRRAARGSRPRPAPASGAARMAFACSFFGLECKVYMVRVSYDQKPYRRIDDGDVGRNGRAQPVAGHERRPRDPRARPGLPGQPRHRHLRGGRGRRHARRHELRARLACSTTCCCTRP